MKNDRVEQTIIISAALATKAAVAKVLNTPGVPRLTEEQAKFLLHVAASDVPLMVMQYLRSLPNEDLRALRAAARKDIDQFDETLRQARKEAN